MEDPNIEAFVFISKYKGDDNYYLNVKGPDDHIIAMTASAITEDARLQQAIEVAEEFFHNFGMRSKN